MINRLPQIGDVEFSTQYENGDRVVVRTPICLPRDKAVSVCRQVVQCCKADVRILLVDCSTVRVTLDKADGECSLLAGKELFSGQVQKTPQLQIGIAKVVFGPSDKITAVCRGVPDIDRRIEFEQMLREWVGADHETMVLWAQEF